MQTHLSKESNVSHITLKIKYQYIAQPEIHHSTSDWALVLYSPHFHFKITFVPVTSEPINKSAWCYVPLIEKPFHLALEAVQYISLLIGGFSHINLEVQHQSTLCLSARWTGITESNITIQMCGTSQKSVHWKRNSPWCWEISLCESLLSFNNRQGQSEHCLPLTAHFIFCLKSNLSVDSEHGRQIRSVVFQPRARRSKLVSHTAPQRGGETRASRQLQLQVISSTLTGSRRLTVGGQQLPQTITNHHWE